MNKKLYIKITFLTIQFLMVLKNQGFCQYLNDYERRFNNGYQNGYCYNDYGCISPIVPVVPVPLINENTNSYQDGYNRGFKRGLEDKNVKINKNNPVINKENKQETINYRSTYVSPDYSSLLKILQFRQSNIEKEEKIKKEQAIQLASQVKKYYKTFLEYPQVVANGWHNAIALNDFDYCEEVKIYVSNNKIERFVEDDYIEGNLEAKPSIVNCKSTLRLRDDEDEIIIREVYFLNFLDNPNISVAPPVGAGDISFWTNIKNSRDMKLYLDGEYVTNFGSFFNSGSPVCGQDGTVTIETKAGRYKYRAELANKRWEGIIEVFPGKCVLKGLVK